MSRPQSSLTTGIEAGTGNWNIKLGPSSPFHILSCFRASLIASLVAQCTEAASSKGGSPEAVFTYKNKITEKLIPRSSNVFFVCKNYGPLEESTRFSWRPLFIISTLNCLGMVSTVGILYVHVLSVTRSPSESVMYSSSMKKPSPCTKAPSIWRPNKKK